MSDYRLLNDVQLWKARHRKKLYGPESTELRCPTRSELLDHIDAMAAREAKLRELHVKRDETYFQWPVCSECMDGEEMAAWPCDTITILDGDE